MLVSEKIAMRLRAARKEAGFKTRKSFAEKCGIPVTTYSQHETGKRKLSIETLIDYCIKLNTHVIWMLTGVGNPWDKQQPIEKWYTAMQPDAPKTLPKEHLETFKKVFLSALPFLGDKHLSFSEWVDRCLEIGMVLFIPTIDDERIEKIVSLVFSKHS